MLIKRSLCIFPRLKNSDLIDHLREKYDPLHNKISPHITLVFPFESEIQCNVLKKHIENVLLNFKPFTIKLHGITGAGNSYLFLNVKEGRDRIINIHDQLYCGILKKYLLRTASYIPHLTIGRIDNSDEFFKAIEQTKDMQDTFEFTVEEVVSEIIDESEESIIEFIVGL